MITVLATREGLQGGKTSTGYLIETAVPFVALPSVAAMRQWIRIFNRKTNKTCRALVLDVGPWNELDHPYVFQPATLLRNGIPPTDDLNGVRPQSEAGIGAHRPATNKAGIDIGESVWAALGMTDNGLVSWEFE